MAIAGVVIETKSDKTMHVLGKLNEIPNVTTYGVHNSTEIVAVFEGDSSKTLEKLSMDIMDNIDGVIGVFPAYVTTEDEMEEMS